MDSSTVLFGSGVILASAAIQGATGFGFAVFAVPLLMLVIEPREAVVVSAFLGLVASVSVALVSRRGIDWQVLRAWTGGALVGLPLGLAIFVVAPGRILTLIVGISIGVVAVLLLNRASTPTRQSKGLQFAVGVPAGVLAGAVGMAGPPVALYSAWTHYPKHLFQATSASFGFGASIIGLCGYGLTGNISSTQLRLAGALLPSLVVGVILGLMLHKRISQLWFDRVILVLLMALAVSLLIRSL